MEGSQSSQTLKLNNQNAGNHTSELHQELRYTRHRRFDYRLCLVFFITYLMNITANGRVQLIENTVSDSVSIYMSGDFGGASVDVQYKDSGGNFRTLRSGSFNRANQDTFETGRNRSVWINVTGGTSIDLFVDYSEVGQ